MYLKRACCTPPALLCSSLAQCAYSVLATTVAQPARDVCTCHSLRISPCARVCRALALHTPRGGVCASVALRNMPYVRVVRLRGALLRSSLYVMVCAHWRSVPRGALLRIGPCARVCRTLALHTPRGGVCASVALRNMPYVRVVRLRGALLRSGLYVRVCAHWRSVPRGALLRIGPCTRVCHTLALCSSEG